MEKWRRVFREGFATHLPLEGLRALAVALRDDDARLLQGTTCYPPALEELYEQKIQACCPVTFCGMGTREFWTIGEASRFFQRACDAADLSFQEPSCCGHFLNWVDDTPRADMRKQLLPEVEAAIQRREAVKVA